MLWHQIRDKVALFKFGNLDLVSVEEITTMDVYNKEILTLLAESGSDTDKETIKNIFDAYNKLKKNIKKHEDFIKKDVKKNKVKNEIYLAGSGKLISEFALEIVQEIKDTDRLFYRTYTRDVIEIGTVTVTSNDEDVTDTETYTGFVSLDPHRFITIIEDYLVPGTDVKIKNEYNQIITQFKPKSMNATLSKIVLFSDQIRDNIPNINRIFTIPIPIMYHGKLTFPRNGYDKRFRSWLPYDAPKINNTDMSLADAKEIIYDILKEFCFKGQDDINKGIAGLLTPFIRGLFSAFNVRTPVFVYEANRERCGKDYLAGITGILYEGHAMEEAPLSTESKMTNGDDELRKKILSAFIGGRKRLHFSNNKGYINNSVFEAVITARTYSDRILGKNEMLTFDNEIDFSLSGNIGIRYTPDFINRSIFIRLFLDIENANERPFSTPDLHEHVLENREKILSALYTLVQNWIDNDRPDGSLNFASFPEWAKICGGIMESAGYDNPCKPDTEIVAVGGDIETTDMKQLFELCYEKKPDTYMTKKQIKDIILNTAEELTPGTTDIIEYDIFSNLDFYSRQGQIKFGLLLNKYIGRVFSEIRLNIEDSRVRSSRQNFKFTKNMMKIKQENLFDKIKPNKKNIKKMAKNSEKIDKKEKNKSKNDKSKANGNDGNVGNDMTMTNETKKFYNNSGVVKTMPTLPSLPNKKNSEKTSKTTEISTEMSIDSAMLHTLILETFKTIADKDGIIHLIDLTEYFTVEYSHYNIQSSVLEHALSILTEDGTLMQVRTSEYMLVNH